MDIYAYWRASLTQTTAGVELLPTGSGVDDKPQPGLWKVRAEKGGPFLPLQIYLVNAAGAPVHTWGEDREVKGTLNGQPCDVMRLHMHARAVSKEDWAYHAKHGRWPGEIEEPGIGHNSGAVTLADRVMSRIANALSWLAATGISSQIDADTAGNHRGAILAMKKEVEKEWSDKEEPHKKAIDGLKAIYKPLVEQLDSANVDLRAAVTVYGNKIEAAENARRQAEYEAQLKADRERREKEEAERAARMRVDPIAVMTEPTPPPPPPPVVPEAFKLRAGGQIGKTMSMRTNTIYTVVDHRAALAYFADHDDVKALVQKLATKVSKAGVVVPGVRVDKERVAQ